VRILLGYGRPWRDADERLEHGLHGFFSAQAASSFERAPGVEVDRELDRREQAFPFIVTDLPPCGPEGADWCENPVE
jgi:hypothetical protein